MMSMLNFAKADERPLIIAHRGASIVAPENTEVAIRKAIGMGAAVVEFDVRETADGVLVLFHDDNLRRIVGRDGRIEDMKWDEVRTLDVGRWFGEGEFAGETPMTLAVAIELCLEGGVTPLIEQKSGSPERYALVLERNEWLDRVVVQSFDWGFLKKLSERLPNLVIGALGKRSLDGRQMARLRRLVPDWVGWKHSDLSETGLEVLHKARFQVAIWTVNDLSAARKWSERGVDGIITDRPDDFVSLLE